MMDDRSLSCPFCGTDIHGGAAECPNCHENLAAWTRLRYNYAIDYNEALAMAREGRLDEARTRLALALQAKEDFGPAHVLMAKIHAQQERWADAQQSIQRACELLPDDPRALELADVISQSAMEAYRLETEGAPGLGFTARSERATGSAHLRQQWLGRYQQDIVRAFAVGVGLTTMMALLISRLSGRGEE